MHIRTKTSLHHLVVRPNIVCKGTHDGQSLSFCDILCVSKAKELMENIKALNRQVRLVFGVILLAFKLA